jgi:hypothetical protein
MDLNASLSHTTFRLKALQNLDTNHDDLWYEALNIQGSIPLSCSISWEYIDGGAKSQHTATLIDYRGSTSIN